MSGFLAELHNIMQGFGEEDVGILHGCPYLNFIHRFEDPLGTAYHICPPMIVG